MKRAIIRTLAIRFILFLLTLYVGVLLGSAHLNYENRQAALTKAAWDGNLFQMRILYLLGVDVNAARDGATALTYAQEKGEVEIVELLRQAGAIER